MIKHRDSQIQTRRPKTGFGAHSQPIRHLLLAVAAAALSACGGGGGDAGSERTPDATGSTGTGTGTSSPTATAQVCAPTNPYRADATSSTRIGTLEDEKRWVRAYVNDAYLWYKDVPAVSPQAASYSNTAQVYASLDNYFEALKSPALTASGKRRDQFSFTYPTKAWNDLSVSGQSAGYGIEWHMASSTAPRGIRIAFVQPGSPAAVAGLKRGDTLLMVDGVSADDTTAAGVDVLNAALFRVAAGSRHSFVFTDKSAVMTAAVITDQPVPVTQVLTVDGKKVGYILFNAHMGTAETDLINAITTLKAANVEDLVLDMRYNGGGYLYMASELAYMVAGPERTGGKVFEQLQFNDKRVADNTSADARTPFYDTSLAKKALPTLNLGRVAILTSANTCSASESVINGLRGVDVDVRLVGATTCGKPYGFTAQDNCGVSYFPIEFKGVNAKGEGDYADGIAATCTATDDMGHALGDPAESQLSGALYHLANGRCNPAVASGRAQAAGVVKASQGRLIRGPERESRIALPGGR